MLMRAPASEEDSERLFGTVAEAGEGSASVFLLGEGVLCCMKGAVGFHGGGLRSALQAGARVMASARDLRARGIPPEELEAGVVAVDDLEGEFLDEAMERAERVISW